MLLPRAGLRLHLRGMGRRKWVSQGEDEGALLLCGARKGGERTKRTGGIKWGEEWRERKNRQSERGKMEVERKNGGGKDDEDAGRRERRGVVNEEEQEKEAKRGRVEKEQKQNEGEGRGERERTGQ